MGNLILEKAVEIVKALDELDDYIEKLPNYQSEADSLLSDYRHFLKDNEIDINTAYNVALKMKKTEIKRSQLKQDIDLANTYNLHKNKLISKENRQFLLTEMYKREKNWGQPYVYRVLTEKEIEELINKPKKRGRPKKEC